ncbi:MAG: metallophosphoesterase [Clostridiales bacterium]|nr:metallophosphoesterase [Clostridiales bacterium]
MKIGIFSDTHGSLRNLAKAQKKLGALDAVFHCGDGGSGDLKRLGEAFAAPLTEGGTSAELTGGSCPVYGVRGNCDLLSDLPEELVVTLAGHRFLLLHGHRGTDEWELARKAEAENCNAVFYGHTHIPLLSAHGPLLVCNPGSLTKPLGGSGLSCALLTVGEKDFDIRLVAL